MGWSSKQVLTTAENCGLKTALMNLAARPEIAPRRLTSTTWSCFLKHFIWKVTMSWGLHFVCVCVVLTHDSENGDDGCFYFFWGEEAFFAFEGSIGISFSGAEADVLGPWSPSCTLILVRGEVTAWWSLLVVADLVDSNFIHGSGAPSDLFSSWVKWSVVFIIGNDMAFRFIIIRVYLMDPGSGFRHFLFSPLPRENDPIWLINVFQMGWFNHQLVIFGCLLRMILVTHICSRDYFCQVFEGM